MNPECRRPEGPVTLDEAITEVEELLAFLRLLRDAKLNTLLITHQKVRASTKG